MNFWTPELEGRLRSMAADGMSGGEIARELGHSRNAIVGKADRLGVRLRGNERKVLAPEATGRRDQHVIRRMAKRAADLARVEPIAADPSALPGDVPVVDTRKTLDELNDETCRWPVGDPQHADFHFCGAQPRAGAPYCTGHCRLAYESTAQRKARIEAWKADQKARAA